MYKKDIAQDFPNHCMFIFDPNSDGKYANMDGNLIKDYEEGNSYEISRAYE